jgi:DNA replication protein DnaC
MLTDEHFARLKSFKVNAFGERLREMIADGSISKKTVEETIEELIAAEESARYSRKVSKLNASARFAQPSACMEDILYLPGRSLDKDFLRRLAAGAYLGDHDHVAIISETGCGKSFVAQALGNAACRQQRSVRYVRHPDLCRELNMARKAGNYYETVLAFEKVDLLIIDDFFTEPVAEVNVTDTFEIVESRVDKGSLIVASLIEPEQWHARIKTKTMADSIIDRIVHRCIFIDLAGPNMREHLAKQKAEPTK